MSFGKDARLLGEVTLMGEKVGADKDFWSALAHNERIFQAATSLVEHMALAESLPINLWVEPTDKTSDLMDWIWSVTDSQHGTEDRLGQLQADPDKLGLETKEALKEAKSLRSREGLQDSPDHMGDFETYEMYVTRMFCRQLVERVSSMSIRTRPDTGSGSTAEMPEVEIFIGSRWWHEDSKVTIRDLARAIGRVVAQRLFLARMLALANV